MPASQERLDREKNIHPTPKNAGLTLTLKLTAYDKGVLELDGTPLHDPSEAPNEEAWLAAVMVIAQKLHQFRREVGKRQTEKTGSA